MIENNYPDDFYEECSKRIEHSTAVISDELKKLQNEFEILEKFFIEYNSEMENIHHLFHALTKKINDSSELYPMIKIVTSYVQEVADSRRALFPADDDLLSLF